MLTNSVQTKTPTTRNTTASTIKCNVTKRDTQLTVGYNNDIKAQPSTVLPHAPVTKEKSLSYKLHKTDSIIISIYKLWSLYNTHQRCYSHTQTVMLYSLIQTEQHNTGVSTGVSTHNCRLQMSVNTTAGYGYQ
jgi:hypothetical protein